MEDAVQTMLVVIQAFGKHAVGDLITDPDQVRQVAAGENARCVVRSRCDQDASGIKPAEGADTDRGKV